MPPTHQSTLGSIGRRLFGGPLLRLPRTGSREARGLRSAAGVSLVFHGVLLVGGTLMAAAGDLRSGGTVAGVEIVLDTRGLTTGPMANRSYAPQPDRLERAPADDATEQQPVAPEPDLLAPEPEPEAPTLLADASMPDLPPLGQADADPLASEQPPPALPLEPAALPQEPVPVLPEQLEIARGIDPGAIAPETPAPPALQPQETPVPPAAPSAPVVPQPVADTPAVPPLLAAAPSPAISEAPAPAQAVAEPIVAPQLAELSEFSEPLPAEPDLSVPEPEVAEIAEPEIPETPAPTPPVPTELAALDLPAAQPEPPLTRSLVAPPPPPAEVETESPQSLQPETPETVAAPPTPTALALPPEPDERIEQAPEALPELPVGPIDWDQPFPPPSLDPRLADIAENGLQTGRADGLDAEISAILSEISCGTLNADIADNGQVRIGGFLTSSTEQDGVRNQLLGMAAITAVDDNEVLVVGNSLCDGLGVYSNGTAELAPDAEVNEDLPEPLRSPPLFGTVQGSRETFVGSSYLELYVDTPDYPAHVYIDYFRPDGVVVHLAPSELHPDIYYPEPGSTIVISDMDPESPTVPAGPPFGMGMVVTLSANAPVFQSGSIRPREEVAEDYLQDLDVALRGREIDPDFQSQYGYVFIEAVREETPAR